VAVQDAVPKKSVGPEHDIDGADGVPVPSGSFHAHFSRSASGSAGAVASRHPPTTSSTPHTLHRLLCRISTPLDRVSGVVPRVADRRAPDVVRSASGAGVRRTQSGTRAECASPVVRAGADEVVLTAMATTTELVAAVDRACARRREASVWHRIAPAIPEACHDIFEFCLTSTLARRNVGDFARHLGVDRSTIAPQLRRAVLPTAHTILSWSRLIGVMELMESSRMSVEQVALTAGFGSAAVKRTFTRRLVGVAPRTLAERGARRVEEEFLALLKQR
jgi:methylphosphotriester-DNA--protein-cysteine methyltransferase